MRDQATHTTGSARRHKAPLRVICHGAASLALIVLIFALGAGSASAVKLHRVVAPETIGPDGTSSSSPSGSVSLAFQQATKRLYALESSSGSPVKLYGFDASTPGTYAPLTGFNPLITELTEDAVVTADNTALSSAGNIYSVEVREHHSRAFGFSSNGSSLSGWPVEFNETATRGSLTLDVAVNPINGEVWVSDVAIGAGGIHRFAASGAFLSNFETERLGQPVYIDFDSNGDLYAVILSTGQAIYKYEAPSYEHPIKLESVEHPVQIAIDGVTHDRYVAYSIPNNVIKRFSSKGDLIEEFGKDLPSSIRGMTINEANGDVYVSTSQKVYLFPGQDFPLPTTTFASKPTDTGLTLNGTVRPDGLALTDCHFEYVTEAAFKATGFSDLGSGGEAPCSPAAGSIPADSSNHAVSAAVGGLSLGTAYRFRLVATNVNGANAGSSVSFQTGEPLAETTGSPVRTATTAHLEGRVFPHGTTTTYHFEYGDEGPCDSSPCTATASQSAGAGDRFQLVSQLVEGLAPNTTYHYRVAADNAHAGGPVFGKDMTLATRASDTPLSHGHLPGPVGSDRAWEQVSIPDSGGNPVTGAEGVSDDGDRAFFRIHGGTPISSTGTFLSPLFAERTPTGWHSENIHPAREQLVGALWLMPNGKSDLSDQIALNLGSGNLAMWRMRPGQPASKVFEENANEFEPPALTSADASRALALIKGTHDPAHPVASGAFNLYDVSSGTPKLIGLMPDGSVPTCGVPHGGNQNLPEEVNTASNWVSPDGSHAFFPSRCGETQLYMRDFGTEETKPISDSPVSGPTCGASFIKSTPEAAFLWTKSRLSVEDSEPASCAENSEDADVYRYDIASGVLKCVTCVAGGFDADVVGSTAHPWTEIAVAADGSRVYFHSPKTLLPGAGDGIYRVMVASGDLTYVGAGFNVGDSTRLGETIAPDGSALTFVSASPTVNALGGQQNGGTQQYYVYNDNDRSLICVSCPQDGSAPLAGVGGGGSEEATGPNMTPLSADGKTFAFATVTPLASADQNTPRAGQNLQGGTDVYEWRDGRQLLVTDGLTNWPVGSAPNISAVTPSGHDIFFTAAIQYTPDALDGYKRLYDARIGGGIDFPPPPKPCPLEVCQGTPKGAPEEQAPSTGSFSGPGNAKQKAHPKKKKAHKKRHHKKARHQRANHKRRTAR